MTASGIPAGPEETRRWWMWTAIALLVVAAVFAVALGEYVAAYRLHGDDFALVRYSSVAAVAEQGVAPWFTSGYASYFDNYLDWPRGQTAFVRPLVNAQFYVASALEPAIGESAYLILNFLWVLLIGIGMMMVVRRYTAASPRTAAIVSIAVALSPVQHPALLSANMATNVLALLLSVFALAALEPRSRRPLTPRLVRCAVLLTAATFAHETALLAAIACGALLFSYSPERPRVRDLAWLALPFGAFALSRSVLADPGAVYALSVTAAGVIVRLKHLALGPMVPYYSLRFLEARSTASFAEVAVWGVLLLANAVMALALVRGLLDGRTSRRRRVGIMLAWLALVSLGVLMEGSPRFMGLSFIVAIVSVLSLNEGRRWQVVIVGAVLIATLSMFWLQFVPARSADLASARYAGAYADHLRRRIAAERPDTVLLVNDPVGGYGSRAMLELASEPLGDMDLIVLNNLEGSRKGAERFEVKAQAGTLTVTTMFGAGQRAVFSGNPPDFAVPNGGFRYTGELAGEGVEDKLEVSGQLRPGRTLLLGVDPRDGSLLPGRVY